MENPGAFSQPEFMGLRDSNPGLTDFSQPGADPWGGDRGYCSLAYI